MKTNKPQLEWMELDGLTKASGHVRQETGDTKELEENINKNGVLNPPTIARKKDGSRVVVDGDRRIKSLLNLGVKHTFCLVHEGLTDAEIAHLSYFLNTLREDVTPIEQALHLKKMIDDWGLTYIQLQSLGYGSKSQISKLLGLIKLPEEIQKKISEGTLTVSHGTALRNAQNPVEMAKLVIKKNWSAAKTEEFIEDLDKKQNGTDKVVPGLETLKGFDASDIEGGSVDCIISTLSTLHFLKHNRPYLKSQISHADRVLAPGGVMAVLLENIRDRENFDRLVINESSLRLSAEFIGQAIYSSFETIVEKHITDTAHAMYKPQTRYFSVLVYKKSGDRDVSSKLADESKLNIKDAVEYLRSVWTFEMDDAYEEVFSRVMKMYSFKGDLTLDLFAGEDAINKVARKLDRRVMEDELAPKTIEANEFNSDSVAEPAEKMAEYAKRLQEETNPDQPKVAIIASKGILSMLRKQEEKQNEMLERV